MDPKIRLDGCGKFRLNRDSSPTQFSPYLVAIPTELSRPIFGFNSRLNLASCFILGHKL